MIKVRIYELAKELNTTSKRLIEKLHEVDIEVKNHMSQLEPEQVDALYKHIGVRIAEEKNEETKKPIPTQTVPVNRQIKTGPRIIRKTQINHDIKEEPSPRGTKVQSGAKNPGYKVLREASNLMPGMMREQNPRARRKVESTHSRDLRQITETTMENENKVPQQSAEIMNNPQVSIQASETMRAQTPGNLPPNEHSSEEANNRLEGVEKIRTQDATNPQAKEAVSRNLFNAQTSQSNPRMSGEASQRTRTGTHKQPQRENAGSNLGNRNFTSNPRRTESSEQNRSESGARRPERRNPIVGNRPTDPRSNTTEQRRTPSGQAGGQRPPFRSNRPENNHGDNRRIEMPRKNDLPLSVSKPEVKRDHQKTVSRDSHKNAKKEPKREAPKLHPVKNEKPISKNVILGEKKGVSEVLSEEYVLKEFYSDNNQRRKSRKHKDKRHITQAPVLPRQTVTLIKISGDVTVKNLAEALKKTATEVIKKLMNLGVMATLNQEIDIDTATLVADEFGVKVEREILVSEEDILFDDEEDVTELNEERPPVVVVMGHVDHGKTSLLDTLRKSNVMVKEAGGITQHIGAYTVQVHERNITFLDTPGHEAFTAMRARGAKVTDIAILVVAADDGVMPQTVEAINHAKAANISIIVAINKIDKPGANPDRVKQELTEHGLVVEEWGGDIIAVPVSAKEGTNIDQLLEMVLLTADVLELKTNSTKQAKGTVIEAKLDKDRGPVATVLVQRGTLKLGDSVVSGTSVGRIRAMVDDKGNQIKSAGPSIPVEILGIPEVLEAGELFYAIDDEKTAKQLAEKRRFKQREEAIKSTARVTLDDLFSQIQAGKVKDLNIIVKADVQGSVEAVKQSLQKLTNHEVRVNIIHGGVGTITESDVSFASVSNAIIIGFNIRPSTNVSEMAKDAGVDIRLYRVIYKAIEDVEAAMTGLLDPTYQEVILGHIEVRQTFKASGIGTIGGGYVIDGKVSRNNEIRLVRNGVVVHEGKLASLKRFKDDAKEVQQGYECGFTIEKFNDLKEADILECFHMEEVKR